MCDCEHDRPERIRERIAERARRTSRKRGWESAIISTIIHDLLYARERPPYFTCEHRPSLSGTTPSFFTAMVRRFDCAACAIQFVRESGRQLDTLLRLDVWCDLCGADAKGSLVPVILRHRKTNVIVHLCEECAKMIPEGMNDVVGRAS